ncbi:MAG: hypothetical protein WDO68_30900 [Gammaproteobacteria bacterium]
MNEPGAVPSERVHEEFERVLASATFRGATRQAGLFRYLIEETLGGRAAYLKEYSLGAQALERGPSFDPRTDPIARVEASRLRRRLELYFATEGAGDSVVIELPKGSYVPVFSERAPASLSHATSRSRSSRAIRHPLVAGTLVLVLAAAAALVLWKDRREDSVPRPVTRLEVALGAHATLASDVGSNFALSPDGTRLAFLGQEPNGDKRLYVRRLDTLIATALVGTVGARGPFFSPDGQWVGFWVDGKLKKVLAQGSASPITLCDATDLLGASWGRDDNIVASLNSSGQLWRVPGAGGPPTLLVDFSRQGRDVRWPQLLPGGKAVLFTASAASFSDADIDVARLDGGMRKTLVRGGTYGRYAGGGSLLYVDRGTLFAVRFDPDRLEVRGAPIAVASSVDYSPEFGYAQFDIAASGTLVYERAPGSGLSTIRWLDGSNGSAALLDVPGQYLWPRLSPDGTRIAYSERSGSDFDIRGYDMQKWIAYGSNESDSWEVYVRAFPDDGSQVRVSDHGGRIPAWSSRGGLLYYETEQHDLMVARYEVKSGRFIASEPHRWSTHQLADTGVLGNFDLAPDGAHAVGLIPAGGSAEPEKRDHVVLVSNVFDELQRQRRGDPARAGE